jgi:hypothetical protein
VPAPRERLGASSWCPVTAWVLGFLGDHSACRRDVDVVHHGPAVFVAELGTGKAFGCGQVLEIFAPNMAGVSIQVCHVELNVAVEVLVDAYGSCCVCHVLSVERGTDIIGSIRGRVRI